MIDRGYLKRIAARGISLAKPVKADKLKESGEKPLLEKKVVMKDPETLEVVKEFESVEKAVEDGFRAPNIAGAIKNGNKYKGHLWAEIED